MCVCVCPRARRSPCGYRIALGEASNVIRCRSLCRLLLACARASAVSTSNCSRPRGPHGSDLSTSSEACFASTCQSAISRSISSSFTSAGSNLSSFIDSRASRCSIRHTQHHSAITPAWDQTHILPCPPSCTCHHTLPAHTNTYKVLPKHSQSPQPTPPRKHKTHTQPQQPHPQVSSFYRCSQHESRGLARVVRHRASTPTPLPSQHIITPSAPPVQALTRIALQLATK